MKKDQRRVHNGETEDFKRILPRAIKKISSSFEKKYRRQSVLFHWDRIVGEPIARNVLPVRIEYETLYLYSSSSTWRNEIQMMQIQMVQKVNNYAGERLIKEIRFRNAWDKDLPNDDPEAVQNPAWERRKECMENRAELASIPLLSDEIQSLKNLSSKAQDEDVAKALFRLSLKQAKFLKWKKKEEWQPCRKCGTLVPKCEEECPTCKAEARDALRREIRAYLREAPWARIGDMEAMEGVTAELVNRERSSMVQRLASRLKLEDAESLAAKQLTMLYRCMPPTQITDDVVRRTLKELFWDIAEPKGKQNSVKKVIYQRRDEK